MLHSTCGRPFSTLQRLRHEFVPGTPACIADVQNTKVSLRKSPLPIKDELKELFPTLLASGAEGMQQFEVVVDSENGNILKSDAPLRVSKSSQPVRDCLIDDANQSQMMMSFFQSNHTLPFNVNGADLLLCLIKLLLMTTFVGFALLSDRMCAVGWTGRWWTQRDHGSL